MKSYAEQLNEFYAHEIETHGLEGTSMIQDIRARLIEIDGIKKYIFPGASILEVGCGNGYTSEAIAKDIPVKMDSVDITPGMIDLCKKRDQQGWRGEVTFSVHDILTPLSKKYDIIFSERCLQNIPTWDDQSKGLANIAAALEKKGKYIMLESFESGLRNVNAARTEIGAPPIAPTWHNLFFNERKTIAHMESCGCNLVEENCCLSGYYFGSRVLLPSLLNNPEKATASSALNDYFCHLPPYGDFSPMKILVFRKK